MEDHFRWNRYNLKMVMVERLKEVFVRARFNSGKDIDPNPAKAHEIATRSLMDDIQAAYMDACSQAAEELGVQEYFDRRLPGNIVMNLTPDEAKKLWKRFRRDGL